MSIGILEKLITKTSQITSIRDWEYGTIRELEIHLPHTDFSKWDKTPVIKCRTAAMHYTDYTPSNWDVKNQTCTLYVDVSHHGRGSQWAKALSENDTIYHLNIDFENHKPDVGKKLFFLGDQTAIGHFYALQQLAASDTSISGSMLLPNPETEYCFRQRCSSLPLNCVSSFDDILRQTEQWFFSLEEKSNYQFFIAGNAKLVVTLRKLLKSNGINGNQIKSKGFWH